MPSKNKKAKKAFGIPPETKPKPRINKLKILDGSSVAASALKKSPHVINLKNPAFEKEDSGYQNVNKVLIPKSLIKNSPAPRPPRNVSLKIKKIGVDFTSGKPSFKSLVSELSLIALLKFIFESITQIFKSQNKLLDYKRPEGKPRKITGFSNINSQKNADEEIEDIFAPPTKGSGGFSVSQNWRKPVVIFAAICLVLILPFQAFSYFQQLQETKDDVLLLTNEAINQLKAGQNYAFSFELGNASQEFNQARQSFLLARNEVGQINVLTTEILKLIPGQGKTVEAGLNLLESGEILAEVGKILAGAGDNLLNREGKDYYQSLEKINVDLKIGIDKFYQAKALINKVKVTDLPEGHRAAFNQVLQALPTVENGLTDLYVLNSSILKILGQKQWQRYLLIFANNNEIRGSGGFMGSFALMDIDRGEIKKLEVPSGGTYDVQGQLIPKVISPEPIHLINTRWEFQDANWWPDFPTSAHKIQWFCQNSWGVSTDGVILMTATLMSQLLKVLGPIEMPDYGITVTGENFITTTQQVIRDERDKESRTPKQILTDLTPKIMERLFELRGDQLKNLIAVLQKGLSEKQLLLFFNDDRVENLILSLDWGGKLKETQGDFLSVVHSNLAGGKTDEVITETIEHQAEVLEDGSIIDTVKLTRTHNGPDDGNVFTGVQNNSYVRFYVPTGSVLLEAIGFERPAEKYFDAPDEELVPDVDLQSVEINHRTDPDSNTDIYEEGGKTVFGNWLQLKPGQTKQVTIRYNLPFKLAKEGNNTFFYSLLAQKQSGSRGSKLVSALVLNSSLKPLTKYPASLEEQNDGKIIKFSSELTTDQFYGAALIAK